MASEDTNSSFTDSQSHSSELAALLLDKGYSSGTKDVSKAEALRWAVLSRHVDLVRQLVEQGANVDSPDNKTGESSLHLAAQTENTDILFILIKTGATLTLECNQGYTALHYAAVNQRIESAKILVSNGCDIEYQGGVGSTPLHMAADRGHSEVVRALIEMGADVKARDLSSGSSPLHHASSKEILDIIEVLIQRGADVMCRNNEGQTPLHTASLCGHAETARRLIAYGADTQAQDNAGNTPLHSAVSLDRRAVVDVLLENGIELEKKNNAGDTALLEASRYGRTELARFLWEKGADMRATDHNGNTPLHHAAVFAEEETMKFFIHNGADLEAKDSLGFTPLLAAASHGTVTSVRLLAERGANTMASINGFTALHYAAKAGYKILVRRLVEWGFDIELKSSDGQTALSVAAEWGHAHVVFLLLDCGADLETSALEDWRPLHFAACNGRADVVEMLLENGADPVVKDAEGHRPQDLARDAKHDSIVKLLEDRISASQKSSKVQSVALLVAAAGKGNLNQMRQYLDQGINVDSMDLNGRRATSLAAENGKVSIMEFLIDRKANLRLTDRNGESALWWASRYGHIEVVQQLLGQAISIDAVDYDGQSPLSAASQKGHENVVELLLQSGSNPNSSVAYGKTALLFAARAGHLRTVELLLSYGADVNYKSPEGDTALSLAESNEDDKMAEILRSYIASAALTKEQKYAEDLLEAAGSGRVAALKRLIGVGTNVDGIEGDRVPIHQAAFSGHINCVKALLDCGADINKKDARNQSALGYAASFGHASIVELLHEKGSNIENQDSNLQTPLGRAAEDGHEEVVKLLLKLGSNTEAKDSQGETPLCHAIRRVHKAIVQILLNQGANINSIDESGRTPFIAAIKAKNLDLVKLLLENGAQMIPQSSNGHSPLCVAASIGAENIVELLLDHGEDVNHSSDNGDTPIHLAATRGHSMVVRLLIEAGADLNLKNKKGRNAWSYAKEYSHESAVGLFSRAGTIRHSNERAVRRREAKGLDQKTLYEHQPLWGERAIRIIELHPGKPGDILSFELIQLDIDNSSSFEALSYEWKDKVGTIPVQCHDKRLLITQNCKAAMERLRGESERRYLWIDSICINQEDKEELNQQVALMTDIYSRAHNVLLWLGEDESEALKLAFKSIPAMADIYEILYRDAGISPSDQFTAHKYNEARDHAAIIMEYESAADGFADLYFRSYFTRAWIFQEIVLASSRGIVMCGPYMASWKQFRAALSGYAAYTRNHNSSFHRICFIDDVLTERGEVGFLDTTSALLPFQASDPRDKIFATIRLSSTRGEGFKRPPIDYKATVQDVFVNATRHFIDYSGGATVWGWLCRPADKSISDLPSWVPDFESHDGGLVMSPFEKCTRQFEEMIDAVPSTTMVSLNINACMLDKVAFKLTLADEISIQEVAKSIAYALDKQDRGMYDAYATSNEFILADTATATTATKNDTAATKNNNGKQKDKAKKTKKGATKKGHKRLSSKGRIREYPHSTNGHAMLKTILESYGSSDKDNLDFASFLAWELSRDDDTPNSSKHAPEYLKRPVEFWENLSRERDDFDVGICRKMEKNLRYGRELVLTEKGYFGITEKGGAEEGMVIALVGGGSELSLLKEETDGTDKWYTFCAHFFMGHLTEEIEKLEQIDQNAKIERIEIR